MDHCRSENVNYITEELKKSGYRINTLVNLSLQSCEEIESDYNNLIKGEIELALDLVVELWCDFTYPATVELMLEHLKKNHCWRKPFTAKEILNQIQEKFAEKETLSENKHVKCEY